MRFAHIFAEEVAVVFADDGESVKVAVGIEIAEADGVVEVLFAESGKARYVVAAERIEAEREI